MEQGAALENGLLISLRGKCVPSIPFLGICSEIIRETKLGPCKDLNTQRLAGGAVCKSL